MVAPRAATGLLKDKKYRLDTPRCRRGGRKEGKKWRGIDREKGLLRYREVGLAHMYRDSIGNDSELKHIIQ